MPRVTIRQTAPLLVACTLGACASPRAAPPPTPEAVLWSDASTASGGPASASPNASTPPQAPVLADTSTASRTSIAQAASAPSAAPTSAPTLDPSTCAAQAGPTYAGCKWTVAMKGRCGGAALVHEPPPVPTCVCNGCETDADCTAKPHGRCEDFAKVCSPNAKACVYDGDLCANHGERCSRTKHVRLGNRTGEPKQCAHDGHGHAVCGPMQAPPP